MTFVEGAALLAARSKYDPIRRLVEAWNAGSTSSTAAGSTSSEPANPKDVMDARLAYIQAFQEGVPEAYAGNAAAMRDAVSSGEPLEG